MTKVPHLLVATKLGISQLVTIKPNRPQHTVSLFALESEISAIKTHHYFIVKLQGAILKSLDFLKNTDLKKKIPHGLDVY